MADAFPLGRGLSSPPADGITSLQFFRSSDRLAASSWDGTVAIYDPKEDSMVARLRHGAPALDAAVQDDAAILSAGLDGHLKQFDIATSTESQVGQHGQAVKCVEWLDNQQLIASSSWDGTLKIWDSKSPNGQKCVATVSLPGKAFAMSAAGNLLAVATSQRQVWAFDLRRVEGSQPCMQRESSLKFQTRCLRCFPNAEGYAISSVEGRVAIEYFESSEEAQAKKFAFKCHRSKDGGEDLAHPVNAIAFHPIYGTFATGGCDAVVSLWDKENKKRLAQTSGYPTSIASLSFNRDGSLLAIAASYTFERGDIEHPPDRIYVRNMADSEVRPKIRP